MSSLTFKIISFGIACIVLVILSNSLIKQHALPSFSEFTNSATTTRTIVATTTKSELAVHNLAQLKVIDVKYASSTIHALIVDTPDLRKQGLSDARMLPKASGMLFVFPESGQYGFWMKDMNFPLDIVWIDSDKVVKGIIKNIATSTYPTIYKPDSDVNYVLEVNAGITDKMNLEVGDVLLF